MTATELTDAARSWVGVRWKHQGRSRLGIDCVGLLYAVAASVQCPTDDVRNYHHRPGSAALYAELQKYCDEVPVGTQQAGDILVVSMRGEDPQHVMLLTDKGTVIHSSAGYRKVVEHRLDANLEARLCKVWRFRGLNG